jgi:biotin transporter BioY
MGNWTDKDVFPYFSALWIILGITGFLLFHIKRDAEFKRRWFPPFVISTGVLFLGFVWLITSLNPNKNDPIAEMLFGVPFVILIMFLNIRMTKFCSNCGKTAYPRTFSAPKFCSDCGASLQDTK